MFNILEHAPWSEALGGARVIDLFAGSGALGLEALSRGATHCRFVERDPLAGIAIADNVRALGLDAVCEVIDADATRSSKRPPATPPFDFAFLDPPYAEGFALPALQNLIEGGWLSEGGLAVLEIGARETAPKATGFVCLDERSWRAAKVVFLRVA